MSRPTHYASNATPVIIAGAPRSGTTFLTTALNSHPQILITNELRAWSAFNDLRRRLQKPSENLPEHTMRETFRLQLMQSLGSFFRQFYRDNIDHTNLGCPAENGNSVDQVIKAFGDKNPGYADTHQPGCLAFIAETLPDARFIHIHRDPRSCAASYKDISVYSDELERRIDVWRRHTGSMVELKDKIGDRVMEVRYEDFVTDKGDALFLALEDHLGVDHASEPIAFLRRERKQPTPYRAPTTPQEKLGQRTFETRLSPDEIARIDDACGDLMERLGYSVYTAQ